VVQRLGGVGVPSASLRMTGVLGIRRCLVNTRNVLSTQPLASAAKGGLLMIPGRSGEPLCHPKTECRS
jgi:hypothetical protein